MRALLVHNKKVGSAPNLTGAWGLIKDEGPNVERSTGLGTEQGILSASDSLGILRQVLADS